MDGIFDYTLEHFGLQQARTYWTGLHVALDLLAEHPEMGTDLNDVVPNIRRLVHEAHAIYYQVRPEKVVIARILGPGQDPLGEL